MRRVRLRPQLRVTLLVKLTLTLAGLARISPPRISQGSVFGPQGPCLRLPGLSFTFGPVGAEAAVPPGPPPAAVPPPTAAAETKRGWYRGIGHATADEGGPRGSGGLAAPVFDEACSRKLSREAAAIIDTEIVDAAAAAGVAIDDTACALLPSRGRYAIQEAAKQEVRHTLWKCGMCGKQFRSEYFLDWHLHRRHGENDTAANGRGGLCLADFCGLVGCPSLPIEGSTPTADEQDEATGALEGDDAAENDADAGADADTGRESNGDDHELLAAGEDGGKEAGETTRTAENNVQALAPSPTSATNLRAGHVHAPIRPRKPSPLTRLTKAQQRERSQCLQVLASCLPLPPPPGSELLPATSESGSFDPQSGSNSATGQEAVADDKLLFLRARAETQQVPLYNRTLALRERLQREFCEVPSVEKVARRREAAAPMAASTVVLISFGVTFGALGLLYLLVLYCGDEPDAAPSPRGALSRRLSRGVHVKKIVEDRDGGEGSAARRRIGAQQAVRRRHGDAAGSVGGAGSSGGWKRHDDGDDGVLRDARHEPAVDAGFRSGSDGSAGRGGDATRSSRGSDSPTFGGHFMSDAPSRHRRGSSGDVGGRDPSPASLRWLAAQYGASHDRQRHLLQHARGSSGGSADDIHDHRQ